jgi:hypothetical protein
VRSRVYAVGVEIISALVVYFASHKLNKRVESNSTHQNNTQTRHLTKARTNLSHKGPLTPRISDQTSSLFLFDSRLAASKLSSPYRVSHTALRRPKL